ncbi:FkbM family methyltransferase [Aliarcobacter butzleri]|uniref:FkbM family methyltransferase n=2 Tax=Aliarcobacter butzleri TaxID=28197 RepID=A0AAP4UYB5_9BACT|nr:FkbM family methyltransferase [Aliarcobacter butzleri]MDN5074652.1 FkbM family methyltransferase [Aliarcobacter butzleri]MDN5132109.1 FkbM family methyltransferase [Aliarcobacter butzleri]NUW28484.1 FkbM family methyltransferase [Aliarcobacter butzleri]
MQKMYKESHDKLFEYSEFIKDRDIQKIEITDDSVVITTRELGIKMVCNRFDEGIAPIVILNFKNYEKNDSDMIFKLVNDNYTVFDIGGNMGWYSIGLYKAKKNIDIHTFEPIPSTYESLVGNAKINGAKIKINNFGLSDKKQDLIFYFHKENSGNASATIMNEERENIEIKCHVDTLDNYFKKNKLTKLDFIKCDVEGAELFTFKGGEEVIRNYKPIVFTEMLRKWSAKFNYHPNEIIEFFKDMGYGCYFATENKLKEIKTMTDETLETNFFFLHKQKHINCIKKFLK